MERNTHSFSFIIRPVAPKDARDINVIRRMPEVAENLLAVPSETICQNEEFIAKQASSSDDHIFCAESDQQQVIGLASLHVRKLARQRHSAVLGIMVHSDFHGRGVGNRLMETLMDLADNWLMLKRVDLTVYPDNHAALRLYEKFGFVSEGIMKYNSIRRGKYVDVLMMARYIGF